MGAIRGRVRLALLQVSVRDRVPELHAAHVALPEIVLRVRNPSDYSTYILLAAIQYIVVTSRCIFTLNKNEMCIIS